MLTDTQHHRLSGTASDSLGLWVTKTRTETPLYQGPQTHMHIKHRYVLTYTCMHTHTHTHTHTHAHTAPGKSEKQQLVST